MKKNNKYDYFEGKQITDPDTGKRVYEINSYRLPSVTTILGATKNQEFLKEWKAKVGEQEAERIKNVSSARGTSMHKYSVTGARPTSIIFSAMGFAACPSSVRSS